MGTISSGTGLISGIDIQGLVKQLMAIEAQPLTALKVRINDANKQKQGFALIGANLLAVKASLQQLVHPSQFLQRLTTSSNTGALTATGSPNAPLGSYSFIVKSLVTTHQLASNGFTDRDHTPVGAGTLTFDVGHGNLSSTTSLSELNGLNGIRGGVVRITDRSGASADIDLRSVGDVNELLDALNSQTGIRVHASVDGDSIKLVDQSGGTGNLVVTDLAGGFAAADLGLTGVSTAGEITGRDVIGLSNRTLLSQLNDGNGVAINGASDDLRFTLKDGSVFNVNLSSNLRFDQQLAELNDGRGVRLGQIRITDRTGTARVIDLSSTKTIQDIQAAIAAADPNLSISLAGASIVVSDSSTATASNLKIEDVTGHAAADLGIAGDVDAPSIHGTSIYRVDTVGAVLRAIQYAAGNDQGKLQAAITADGNSLVLTDTTSGAGPTTVESLNGSNAARDLGLLGGFDTNGQLTSRRLIAGLNTVLLSSLNGGTGVRTGQVQFVLRDGNTRQVDFTGAQTLAEVIDRMNAAGGLSAQVNNGGTGIVITDNTTGAGQLEVSDLTGNTAADLHLAAAADQLASGDLHLQYISDATQLADLNGGNGIGFGQFQITNSKGTSATITLNANIHETVGDVLKEINNLNIGVTATINSTGDGIALVDSAGGPEQLTVTDEQGTSAKDLHIAGAASQGSTAIDGSFAVKIEVGSSDTLDDVAAKINDAGVGVRASVLSQGAGPAPYFLSITSGTSGMKGRISFDTGTTGLSFNTLTQARDATVVLGDPNTGNARVIRSSSNTITGAVDGLTLNLVGTSDTPVNISVTQDNDSIVTAVDTFIKAYNAALDQIDTLTAYDPDTNTGGVLQSDSTARQIASQLLNRAIDSTGDPSLTLKRLSDVGIFLVDNDPNDGKGARMSLGRTLNGPNGQTFQVDGEKRLRDALQANPNAVKDLFTKVKVVKNDAGQDQPQYIGIAARLNALMDKLAQGSDSTIGIADDAIDQRITLFSNRADEMQKLLDIKQQQLLSQFQAMESALASLQGQQSALSGLASLAASLSSSVSSGGLSSLGAG